MKFPGFRSGLRFIRVVVNRSGVGFTADQFPQGAPSPGPTSDKLVCRGYLIRLECYNTYVPIYTPQSVKCLGTYLPKRLISIRVLYSSRSNTYRIRVNVRGKLWKLLKRDCHAVEHGDSRVTLDD